MLTSGRVWGWDFRVGEKPRILDVWFRSIRIAGYPSRYEQECAAWFAGGGTILRPTEVEAQIRLEDADSVINAEWIG
jgi:hypothetical protein